MDTIERTRGRGRAGQGSVLAMLAVLAACGDAAGPGGSGGADIGEAGGGASSTSGSDGGSGSDDAAADDSGGLDLGSPVLPTCEPAPQGGAIDLLGAREGVQLDHADALGLQQFTLEAWIRWDGYGSTASSGVGGVTAEPIITKGRGESDGGTIDCNYFFGIDDAGRLVADFEDLESGANHPVQGQSAISRGQWHHVAASFDGASWQLWLDGVLDGSAAADAVPRHDSVQPAGIGTAFDSMARDAGSFDGRIDEVRIWNRALDAATLQAGMFAMPPDATGLVARYPLDEAAGTAVPDAIAGLDGERLGGTWVDDARPLRASTPPAVPSVEGSGATVVGDGATLSLGVVDLDDDEMRVEIWGRALPQPEPFTIAVLPDTQYYCDETHGGVSQMFYDQTQWLADNAESIDLRAVLHVGDLVDDGHTYVDEWLVAGAALETLEQPLPGLDEGVPYGVAIGNHDQATNSHPGETGFYNQYFGVARFEGRSYYGGHHGDSNNASFITFTGGGTKWLALFFEFDQAGIPEDNAGPDPAVMAWARRVLADHPDHYAIAVAHSCLVGTENGVTVDTPFSSQGLMRWHALRGEPNLRLMVCGHVADEGRRTDVAASTVHTLLSDYQFDGSGGSGKLRLMTLRPDLGTLEVQTYSPYRDQWYESDDAHFELPVDLDRGAGEFELIATVEHAVSGEPLAVPWTGLQSGVSYEWFARVDDCTHRVDGTRQVFTMP
ncbi:MAG: metallophosphoesterase [Nannocystaceae bacterium]|nr:metallophosphoesterase [Nannocystaceae bacterium]